MSDYIFTRSLGKSNLYGGSGAASINLQLVHVLNKLYLKVTNLSSSILSNTKWYQGNYHARRTEGTWCDSSRL